MLHVVTEAHLMLMQLFWATEACVNEVIHMRPVCVSGTAALNTLIMVAFYLILLY